MEDERVLFDGFLFPVLPGLTYQADGPDKNRPDRLFIEDREKRFLLYLESDGAELAPSSAQETDYDTLTLFYHSRRLELIYPLQRTCPGIYLGYFHILLPGQDPERPCTGSLCIAPPEPYWDGLWKYRDLAALFTGLELWDGSDGKPAYR